MTPDRQYDDDKSKTNVRHDIRELAREAELCMRVPVEKWKWSLLAARCAAFSTVDSARTQLQ